MTYPDFPRCRLGFFPTPLTALGKLSAFLGGPKIFIKRDDHTGLALGGNKTRKLEFLLGEALVSECDAVVTAGAMQSNHCRQTAAAAAALGLPCHLVLGGEPPVRPDGNLLLDMLLGATLHWSGAHRKGERIPEVVAQLRAKGANPYVIPYGGSNAVGALGFVEAAFELKHQSAALEVTFDHIVFASSSGGTHAGLMVGRDLAGIEAELIGIEIDKPQEGGISFAQHVAQLANETAEKLGMSSRYSESQVLLKRDYVGAGYGVIGDPEREAILLMARREGILLDPVYTGRAMAGLMGMIRRRELGADGNVLFWHTGGAPALFPYSAELVGTV
jgi:L-cysteate sulfo-lyase